jgi:hypothetical protein
VTAAGTIPHAYGIFQQPWWLDAVAPGAWAAVTVETAGGEVVGRLPFVRKRRLGLTVLTQPPLTPFLGPWLKPLAGKLAAQFSQQERIVEELIARLPRHDIFQQSFHHSIGNWLPFLWAGFQQTTHYTYLLQDLRDMDGLWRALHTDRRNRIRKAQQEVVVRVDDDIDKFLHFHRAVFTRQSLPMNYPEEIVRRIHEACRAQQAGVLLVAEDRNGRTHAMTYVVWDERTAYGLMAGADPDLRSSGAISLVIWEGIKYAARVTRCFDLAGSVIRPIEYFLRGFGGELTPYSLVFGGQTRAGRIALTAHGLLHHGHRGGGIAARLLQNGGTGCAARNQAGKLVRLLGGRVLDTAACRNARRG